jgi:hypothetical protein
MRAIPFSKCVASTSVSGDDLREFSLACLNFGRLAIDALKP